MYTILRVSCIGLLIGLLWSDGYAQRVVLRGVVRDDETRTPLGGVRVERQAADETTYSDDQGRFSLTVAAGQTSTLLFSLLGKQPVTLDLAPTRDTTLTLSLKDRSFGLDEVVVVAKEQRLGSSSVIDKLALVHVQPTSLADVLQLIPGQLAQNPSLGAAQQVTLRQVPTTSDALRNNALGTAIIQDGVPISNNANLQVTQTILNAAPGSLPPFSSVAGRGVDLRQLGADNIESVEVVRGIPSARYGDLTSGLILIESRIGSIRPEVRVRLHPTVAQAAFIRGFSFDSRHTLNLSVDLLRAQRDPRDRINTYTRLNGQVAWRRKTPAFTTTTILKGYRTLDDRKLDPSDSRSQRQNFAREWGLKASTEGRWRPGKGWMHRLRYLASLTYSEQKAYTQELITRDQFPLSTALVDTTLLGRYGESEYLSQLAVDGRPLNGYANWEAGWQLRYAGLTHALSAGMELRYDVNLGAGRQFDPARPPRQNYGVGERPRAYTELPALFQLGYYLDNKLTGQLGRRTYILQAGVRLDNIQPAGPFVSTLGMVPAPRLNIALETVPGLFLRAGYGLTVKAPTLDVLFPGPRFFDLVNLNYFAANPAERLVLITTRVLDPGSTRLAPFRSRKVEVGADGQWRGFSGAVSVFREETTGAYGTNRLVQPYALARYGIMATPAGAPPVLTPQPTRFDTVFVGYDLPVANRRFMNQGVEFSLLTPEWKSLRTSFQWTGAWIRSNAFDEGIFIDADRAYTTQTVPQRIAIYQGAANRTASRFNTSLRIIHRMPALRLVVSGLWQTIWQSTNRSLPLSPFPLGYIDRRGHTTWLTAEQGASDEFAELRRTIDPRLEIPFRSPPLHLFNLRVTKEWARGYGFSFFANNVSGHRPLIRNPQSGVLVRRNEPLVFGAEINLVI